MKPLSTGWIRHALPIGPKAATPDSIGYWQKRPGCFRIPQQVSLPIGPACPSAENNKQDRVKTVGMDAGKRDFTGKYDILLP